MFSRDRCYRLPLRSGLLGVTGLPLRSGLLGGQRSSGYEGSDRQGTAELRWPSSDGQFPCVYLRGCAVGVSDGECDLGYFLVFFILLGKCSSLHVCGGCFLFLCARWVSRNCIRRNSFGCASSWRHLGNAKQHSDVSLTDV